MREFFRGWKPTVGLVTLVLALMFTGGWVRSQLIFDASIRNHGGYRYSIMSFDGMIDFKRISEVEGWPSVIWDSGKVSQIQGFELDENGTRRPFDPWESIEVNLKWDCGRFHFGSGMITWGTRKLKYEAYVIPYWSLVLPLTAISAFLLLSKRGHSNEKVN